MAEVTVFVDDAVRGHLPGVCAKDGVATGSRLKVVEEVGQSNRLGILWLLIFTGPLGWIALAFLSGRERGEYLTVELPYSDAAYDRFVAARRSRNAAAVGGLLSGIGLLVLMFAADLGPAGILLLLVVGAITVVAVLIAEWRMGQTSVDVSLDASRRWVTLRGVHPSFAAACTGSLANHV